MPRRKPTAIYRKILASAGSLAWQRKSLWVFGFLASLVATGGVYEVAFRSLSRIKESGSILEQILTGSFAGYQTFSQYILLLQTQNPVRITVTITLLSLLLIALVIIIVLSQAALFSGLMSKKEKNLWENLTEARPYFWKVLTLDVVIKVVTALFMLMTTLPLVLLLTRGNLFDALLYFGLFLILFPGILIINILGMLALIEVVKKKKTSVITALHNAWSIFLRHWLAAFELGLIIFFVMLGGFVLTSAAIVLITVPYAALTTLAVLTGTPIVFVVVNLMGAVAIGLVTVIITGAVVTYQHALWIKFHERASHRSLGKKALAKLERMWR